MMSNKTFKEIQGRRAIASPIHFTDTSQNNLVLDEQLKKNLKHDSGQDDSASLLVSLEEHPLPPLPTRGFTKRIPSPGKCEAEIQLERDLEEELEALRADCRAKYQEQARRLREKYTHRKEALRENFNADGGSKTDSGLAKTMTLVGNSTQMLKTLMFDILRRTNLSDVTVQKTRYMLEETAGLPRNSLLPYRTVTTGWVNEFLTNGISEFGRGLLGVDVLPGEIAGSSWEINATTEDNYSGGKTEGDECEIVEKRAKKKKAVPMDHDCERVLSAQRTESNKALCVNGPFGWICPCHSPFLEVKASSATESSGLRQLSLYVPSYMRFGGVDGEHGRDKAPMGELDLAFFIPAEDTADGDGMHVFCSSSSLKRFSPVIQRMLSDIARDDSYQQSIKMKRGDPILAKVVGLYGKGLDRVTVLPFEEYLNIPLNENDHFVNLGTNGHHYSRLAHQNGAFFYEALSFDHQDKQGYHIYDGIDDGYGTSEASMGSGSTFPKGRRKIHVDSLVFLIQILEISTFSSALTVLNSVGCNHKVPWLKTGVALLGILQLLESWKVSFPGVHFLDDAMRVAFGRLALRARLFRRKQRAHPTIEAYFDEIVRLSESLGFIKTMEMIRSVREGKRVDIPTGFYSKRVIVRKNRESKHKSMSRTS